MVHQDKDIKELSWDEINARFPAEIQSMCRYLDKHQINKELIAAIDNEKRVAVFKAWVKGEINKFEELVRG